MPSQRPYRSHSLDALFLLAREHWETIHVLRLVLDELADRTTPAAKERHAELRRQVQALEARQDAAMLPSSQEVIRLRAEAASARRRIAELEHVLREARETITSLQRDLAAATRSSHPAMFRRVGLHESCPDFVLKAVRTAYRKTLHPDLRMAPEKAQAEARFKEAEAVFAALFALRKL